MKALSIRMPWAYLCARGIKTIENRTWNTKFRGRFYIHAGQKFDMNSLKDQRLIDLDVKAGIHIAWLAMLWDRGISGIIGEATLVRVTTRSDSMWFEGPYGFCLGQVKLYQHIILCKGRQGFFEPYLTGNKIDLAAKLAELEDMGVKV